MRITTGMFVALALVAGACGSDETGSTGDGSFVSGTVVAPAATGEPLPDDAVLVIRLEDISRADAPATVLAEQSVELADAEFPVAFELAYDDAEIDQRNTYRVAARVESGGELLQVSDTVIPVITNGAPTAGVEVPLVLIASN